MFKNKFVLAVIAGGIVAIFFYMFSSAPTFLEKSNKLREEYKLSLVSGKDSPLKNINTDGIRYFQPDEKWIIEGEFEKSDKNKEFKVQMTDSTSEAIKLSGIVTLRLEDKHYTLMLFDEGANYVLPFRDLTNAKETYGGGRYVNIDKGNLRGNKITIDFNESHNYYCAYSEEYVCPVPPLENSVQVEIKAGEMNFQK